MATSLLNGLGGSAGFGENFLGRNDDGSTGFINLAAIFPGGLNYFGNVYNGLWLNNNGSVTFSQATGSYTPTSITGSFANPIIAPFWADVDTRGTPGGVTPGGTSTGSNLMWYDLDPVTHSFIATWDDVGYYGSHVDKLNAFQMRLTAVPSGGGYAGDFDIEFRYEAMNWVTGDASGGSGGLGGTVAHAGYSSSNGVNYLELPQSGNQAGMLDLENASNVGQPGLYQFSVRNGAAVVAASVDDVQIQEGNGPGNNFVVVPVRLSAPAENEITLSYQTANGSAASGSDYLSQRGTVTFAPGVTQQNIYIEIVGDTVPEADETFVVNLSGSGVSIADSQGQVTILNDDGLAVSAVSANEGSGTTPTTFSFTVSLLTASKDAVTVDYATKDGSAIAGTDYTATSGKLTFAPGETTKTVDVQVTPDFVVEPDETFTLQLSNAAGAPIAKADGLGTIVNDDGIVVRDLRVVEGTGSTPTTATVTLALQSPSDKAVTVDWVTQNGKATSPGDFTASSGTATFAAGATTASILVPIVADALVEGDETFEIVLSNPVGSAIVDGTGTVTIADDDGFQVSDVVITEGSAGGTVNATFTVTLQSALATVSTVNYATRDGTAGEGTDYTKNTGTLTFGAGVTSQTVTVLVAADSLPETDETFFLDLSNPSSNAGISRGTGQATILNDDGFSVSNATVTEGNTGTTNVSVTVTLSGPAAGPTSVAWTTADGTASAPTDYVADSGVLAFAAGETSKTLTLKVNGDTTWEANETFRVVLSNPTGSAIVDGSGTITITNDDTRPPPVLTVAAASVTEGNEVGNTMRFLVTLDRVASNTVTVDYSTSAGTATAGDDYTTTNGKLTITQGSLFGVISVPVVGDTLVEPDETLTITLANVSGDATIGKGTATGTILNDDSRVSIAAADATKLEGNGGATTPFTFTATRTGDTTQTQTVGWVAAAAAVNPAQGNDFVGGAFPSGVVTFNPGESSKVITVNVAGDNAAEGNNEDFVVTLANPSSGLQIDTASAQGSILNDDAILAFFTPAVTKAEGTGAVTQYAYVVNRAGYLNSAVSATWTVAGAGANPANALDFQAGAFPTGTVSFAAGETSKTIVVDVVGDTTVEADEGFSITLSNPSPGAAITVPVNQGTILNDDATLAITAGVARKAEGNTGTTAFSFNVTRAGFTGGAASVNWAVLPASQANGADFAGGALPSGTVTFAVGETSKVITIDVATDSVTEADEDFVVQLSGASTGNVIVGASASGTILNDDATVAIAATAASKVEGNAGTTPFTFTVTRAGFLTSPTSLNWGVTGSGGSPANATDFGGTLPTGTVSFAAGETSKVITVNVTGDSLLESNETFAVTLSGALPGTNVAVASATGTILNDDSVLSIAAASPANKLEGQSGTTQLVFSVDRAGSLASAATANWAVSGTGGAGSATKDDFVGGAFATGTVSFAAGEATKTIVVNVAGDTVLEPDEFFNVTLSSPSAGASIANATATGTIRNDDATVSIVALSAVKNEGTGGTAPFTFTVTRTGFTDEIGSVDWSLGPVALNSADGTDFVGGPPQQGTISFNAGETSKTLTLTVVGDSLVEPDEGFQVILSNPIGMTIAQGTAAGTILNDDVQTVPDAPTAPDLVASDDVGFSSTDNLTSLTTPLFTGRALPGGKISLFDGTTLVGTGTVGGLGNYAVRSKALTAGVHSFTATVTNDTGGTSLASSALAVTIDTTPPALPSVPDLIVASDTGLSNADNKTSVTTPTFQGRGEAGTQVIVFDGITAVGSGIVGALGNWAVKTSALAQGVHAITARAMDPAGNVSAASAALSVTIDTSAPVASSAPDLIAASDSGLSPIDNLTNVTTPTFQGKGEAGAQVTLLEGATILGTGTVGALGNWAVKSTTLVQGKHNITAKITDAAGNVSPLSTVLAVTIDTTVPAPSTVPDLAAASDTGVSNVDNITSDTTPTFTGKGEGGARVTIFSDGGAVGTGTVGALGNWAVTTSALGGGIHAITAQITDVAGNVSTVSPALSVTIDNTAPAVSTTPDLVAASDTGPSSTDNVTTDTTPTFQGKAEGNAQITLFADGVQVGTSKAGALGAWAVTTSALATGDYLITAKVTDAAGNVSAASPALTVVIEPGSVAASAIVVEAGSDDIYRVDDPAAVIDEPAGGGTDTVLASVGYRLPTGSEIEFLTAASGKGLLLAGNETSNTITGGAGDDTIEGGGGADILIGGAGADLFAFMKPSDTPAVAGGSDTIMDFGPGDAIGLSTIDANDLIGGDQAFAFIGAAGFSGSGGELRAEAMGAMTVVSGDTNGDRLADFAIRLAGAPVLGVDSFRL